MWLRVRFCTLDPIKPTTKDVVHSGRGIRTSMFNVYTTKQLKGGLGVDNGGNCRHDGSVRLESEMLPGVARDVKPSLEPP